MSAVALLAGAAGRADARLYNRVLDGLLPSGGAARWGPNTAAGTAKNRLQSVLEASRGWLVFVAASRKYLTTL